MAAAIVAVWPSAASASYQHVCAPSGAPVLCEIHHHVHAVHRMQRLLGVAPTPYQHAAERNADPDFRLWVRRHWYHRHVRWNQRLAIPEGVAATLMCIHPFEEPSWSTVAGGLGFVYSPSSYGGVAARLAGTYGDSWYGWPVWAQLQVGYMLVQRYGYAPWTTAYHCV